MKLLFSLLFGLITTVSLANNNNNLKAEVELNNYIDSFFVANGIAYSEAETILFSFNKRVKSMKQFNKYVIKKLSRAKAFPVGKFDKLENLDVVSKISDKLIKSLEQKLYELIQKNELWNENTFITQLNLLHKNYIYWNFEQCKPIDVYYDITKLKKYSLIPEFVNKIQFIYYIQKIVKCRTYTKHSKLNIQKLNEIEVEYVKLVPKDSSERIENSDSIGLSSIAIFATDPIFPGGTNLMAQFISSNFVYPKMARELGLSGTIYIQFVVDIDGSIIDVCVVELPMGTPAEILCKEGVRLIRSMPKWKQGTQNNKKVKVRYTIPIKCSLG